MMKKKLMTVILALLIISTAVGIGVGIYMNRPETVMKTSIKNLVTDVFEREEFEVVSNMLESGSAEMITSLSVDKTKVSLEYKEYFGLKNNETYIEKLKLSVNDFSLDGSFYMGEDYMYMSVPSIYASPVGLVRGETEKTFDDSVFAYGSDTSYELGYEVSDAIKILCRIYDGAKDKELKKDAKEILDSYVKLIMDSIGEHADIEKENGTTVVHGEDVSARVISIVIDDECIYNVMVDLHKELSEDKKIPKLIEKYGVLIEEYLDGTSFEDVVSEALEEENKDNIAAAVLEAYEDMLDEFEGFLEEAEEELEEDDSFKIYVELATKKASSNLISMNIAFKEGQLEGAEKQEILDIQIGKQGIKKSERVTVTVAGETEIDFEVKQKDSNAYKSEITVSSEGDEITTLYVDIDKSEGEFEFGVKYDESSYAVTGDYSKSGKTHTFDFKDIIYDNGYGEEGSLIDEIFGVVGAPEIEFELKLIICENAKPNPISKDEIKSVFSLSETDFNDIQYGAEKLIDDLKKALGISVGIPEIDYDGSYGGIGW